MMKQHIRAAIIAGCFLLSACTTTKDPEILYKGQSAQQIYTGAEQNLANGKYDKAISHYEGLDALYPFSSYSEQAMLDSIYAYYESGDFATATATAERFTHTYPANPHVDYAYYMKGVCEMIQDRPFSQRYLPMDLSIRDLTSPHKAYLDFAALVEKFPNSPYTPDAKLRMAYLRNLFAQRQVEIAEFYYKRHAYVASANRASIVVEKYPGTPAEKEALEMMVKSYQALGQTEEAAKAQRLITNANQ
ncbi:MAG TPA: outer membrane protein assembly factor BamD [Gammaproteobacteria bacterium]|nr:outer membrane protein assembly factor BamD [Gammaproteobacteria bacterium]